MRATDEAIDTSDEDGAEGLERVDGFSEAKEKHSRKAAEVAVDLKEGERGERKRVINGHDPI